MPSISKGKGPVSFSAPPLVEVVCGAAFSTQTQLQSYHSGIFKLKVQDDFPCVQEVPPLPPVLNPNNPIQFHIGLTPTPRIQLSSQDQTKMIQFQQDRFIYNWRKENSESAYPRYGAVYNEFKKNLGEFSNFIENNSLGPISLKQLELTYVNIIDYVAQNIDLESILVDHIANRSESRVFNKASDINWTSIYLLEDNFGRLFINAKTVFDQSDLQKKLLRLDISAKGINPNCTTDNLGEWFNIAHNSIVRAFTEITSQDLQLTNWGRDL